ncbi:uncharacterized protein GGS25DRAFT_521444 [Hypoxylon fragiforme]|uniref:uncharacterized protein n=1 Tax=Hypoxylon fragiforme TaxID=63214 RepID=UPI0020C5BD05|nr:uncharacterized protein GGS25DRAFT_521444 [Hypoxylon fragiforme]KAI2608269.1 hypothetical protein GGS25DRAFT_521444 [Hypoxylon fragiforme]
MASTHTAMILAAFSADDAQHTGVDKELQAFTMLLLMLESEDAYMETVTIDQGYGKISTKKRRHIARLRSMWAACYHDEIGFYDTAKPEKLFNGGDN